MDVECACHAGLDAAQIDVLNGDVIDLEVVVILGDVVGGDDAGGGVNVRAAANDAAGEGGVVAVEREAGDMNVAGLNAEDGAADRRIVVDVGDGRSNNGRALSGAGQRHGMVDNHVLDIGAGWDGDGAGGRHGVHGVTDRSEGV